MKPAPLAIIGGIAALAALALLNDRARLAALDTWDELTDMTDLQAALENRNVRAFLMMIRTGEGTADANGYRRIVGGALFDSYTDHPNVLVTLTNRDGSPKIDPRTGKPLRSTAAGAYQIKRQTWLEAKAGAQLADFTPPSQDLAAVWLIRRRGALADAIAGRFNDAVRKCRQEWASLPGAGYGQPEKTLAQARAAYERAGGMYA